MSLFDREIDDSRGIVGDWESSGYSATDEEAHRDIVYKVPSSIAQTIYFFLNEFRLFKKEAGVYVTLVLALLPMFMIIGVYALNLPLPGTTMIGLSLFLAPFMVVLISSSATGKQINHEIKSRSAYMSLSFPIKRASFTVGKFFAGYLVALALIMEAFVLAIVAGHFLLGGVDWDVMLSAMLCLAIGSFAISATAYFLGTVFNHGSMAGLLVMFILLPFILIGLGAAGNFSGNEILGSISPYLYLVPSCLPDLALQLFSYTGLSLTSMVGSLANIYGSVDYGLAMIVGVVWGFAFLILAVIRVNRKDL